LPRNLLQNLVRVLIPRATLPIITIAVERIADATESAVNQDERICDSLDRFQDNGDGTATDRCLNIMWSLSRKQDISFQEADDWISSNDLGGDYNDWRLPTIQELLSLQPLWERYGSVPPIPVLGPRILSQTILPGPQVWVAKIYEFQDYRDPRNPPRDPPRMLGGRQSLETNANSVLVAVRDITE
jgi:hypothetical protein